MSTTLGNLLGTRRLDLGAEKLSPEADSPLATLTDPSERDSAPVPQRGPSATLKTAELARTQAQVQPWVQQLRGRIEQKLTPDDGAPPAGDIASVLSGLGGPSSGLGAGGVPVREEGKAWAKEALGALLPPPADHPMMQHSAKVRSELEKEGLPTRADGVKIYAVGEQTKGVMGEPQALEHGPAVVRSIAGPVGLGQGADVELWGSAAKPEGTRPEGPQDPSKLTLKDLGQQGLDDTEDRIKDLTADLKAARERAPNDGKTKLVTASYGVDPLGQGSDQALELLPLGGKSAVAGEIDELRRARGKPPIDWNNEAQAGSALNIYAADAIDDALKSPEGKARIDKAKEALAEEVRLSRAAGIMPLVSSGNEGIDGDDEHLSAQAIKGVPGLTLVGAADLGADPLQTEDDRTAHFSSPADITARGGVNMPVMAPLGLGRGQAEEINGTSFSMPYLAGNLALALKANPQLRPDDLDRLLRDPRVLRDDPNTARDGAGIIDEVALVRVARDWK